MWRILDQIKWRLIDISIIVFFNLSEFRFALLDTLTTTLSSSTQKEIYKNILVFLQGLLPQKLIMKNICDISYCFVFACLFFRCDMCNQIIVSLKSDFLCVKNRSTTTQVLRWWKLLCLSEEHFPQLWFSRFVHVCVTPATNAQIRGKK